MTSFNHNAGDNVGTAIPAVQFSSSEDLHASAHHRAQPLPLRHKVTYAVGQVVEGAALNSITIFLLFYVTSVCGLPGGLAGAALAIGLIVDAILDPIIGSVSDNLRSPLGRRVPVMLLGLPLVAITFVAIFSLPAGWSTMALFAWVTFLSIALRISLSIFILPYSAASAELTDDARSRSSIMAWRWTLGMVGMLIAMLLAFRVFLGGPTGLSDRAGYLPFAISVASLAVIGGGVASFAVLSNRQRAHSIKQTESAVLSRLWGEVREIFGNQSFRNVFLTGMLFYTGSGAQSALNLHAYTYFWRLPSGAIQFLTLALVVGFLLGAPIAGPLLKRIENRTMVMIGLGGVTICATLPPLLRIAGFLPLEGNALVAVLAVTQVVSFALLACAAIATPAMMADVADEHEYLAGTRREGMLFAGAFFSSKAASGAGALVAGLILQIVGLPSAEEVAKVAQVPADKVLTFGLLYALIPGLLVAGSALNPIRYRLTRARHREILADLNVRRTAVQSAANSEGFSA